MKKIITFLLSFLPVIYSQQNNSQLIGTILAEQYSNGVLQTKIITNPEPANGNYSYTPAPQLLPMSVNNSMIRWSFTDAIAIASRNAVSANGLYEAAGWDLNTERISLYNNLSNTPLWEFPSNPNTNLNFVAISDTGGYIVNGSFHNIYIFNRSSSTPIFNFNLETQLPDTGIAGPVDITSDGGFIIASASRTDSSWIFGFNRSSTNWVWRYRVGQTSAGGASIQGAEISANDSLVIVNTYGGFYVFRTYTGQLVFQGQINPISTAGTQFPQAISGNGNVIATINYSGYIRVYQWSGSTYNFLWQHQEPPGIFSNWMTGVDISFDGSLIACGTLNFITTSSYDGKVKLFRTTNGSTPLWTYSGMGDEVSAVAFSKDGKILAAATWGDLSNVNNDVIIFKTNYPTAAPIFGVNSPGSFFWCSVSDNGSTVVASGKRVHARTFGNGGEVYNVFIDTSDVPVGIGSNNTVPEAFKLHQNYPNPFNPVTQINYDIPEETAVNITVFDAIGREITVLVNKQQKSGRYSVIFEGEGLTSGVYFYKITAGEYTGTKKLILLK